MSSNVIDFPGETTCNMPPRKILEGALEADLDDVIVLGWDKFGQIYIATSDSSVPHFTYTLDIAKHITLVNQVQFEEE